MRMLRAVLAWCWRGLSQFALWLDCGGNVVLFFGNPGTHFGELLSARAWRQGKPGQPRRWVAFRVFIDVLFIWQDAALWMSNRHDGRMHCQRTFDAQRRRYGLHPQYNQPESAS